MYVLPSRHAQLPQYLASDRTLLKEFNKWQQQRGKRGQEEEEEVPTPRRRSRRTSDLPHQKRLYSFLVKVKRWRYVSRNDWRVIAPEEGSIPMEEAEVRRGCSGCCCC